MPTKVTFEYDEQCRKWETYVEGVADSVEARQAFNCVVITCGDATPRVDCNRAEQQPDGRWKISVGI